MTNPLAGGLTIREEGLLMTNPLAGGPEDAPRKPDDPQPSPHGRDLTQLPRVGHRPRRL